MCSVPEQRPNYAFKPIAEQALRSNQTIVPQRLNAALERLMNSSDIYWIEGIAPNRIAFGPRPRSGDWLADEIAVWADVGVKHVVCLLESSEIYELGLDEEGNYCVAKGIQFHTLPMPDRGLPESTVEARHFVAILVAHVENGEPVFVHCRMGIGRSGLISACLLLHLGVKFEAVFPLLKSARGLQVPDTQAQIEWVRSYSMFLSGAL